MIPPIAYASRLTLWTKDIALIVQYTLPLHPLDAKASLAASAMPKSHKQGFLVRKALPLSNSAGTHAERGRVPPGLLADCIDVAAAFAIERGRVEAVRGLHGFTLRFSPAIPAGSHQRFRNVFGVHLAGRR